MELFPDADDSGGHAFSDLRRTCAVVGSAPVRWSLHRHIQPFWRHPYCSWGPCGHCTHAANHHAARAGAYVPAMVPAVRALPSDDRQGGTTLHAADSQSAQHAQHAQLVQHAQHAQHAQRARHAQQSQHAQHTHHMNGVPSTAPCAYKCNGTVDAGLLEPDLDAGLAEDLRQVVSAWPGLGYMCGLRNVQLRVSAPAWRSAPP